MSAHTVEDDCPLRFRNGRCTRMIHSQYMPSTVSRRTRWMRREHRLLKRDRCVLEERYARAPATPTSTTTLYSNASCLSPSCTLVYHLFKVAHLSVCRDQAITYDHILTGRDIIGKSRTGTGKTIAFGLPVIQHLARFADDHQTRTSVRGRSPRFLVICPTRELARQVRVSRHSRHLRVASFTLWK